MSIPSFVLGIAGGTGAGKTTVAREVTDALDGSADRSWSDYRTGSDTDSERSGDRTTPVPGSVTHIPLDNYYEDRSDLPFAQRKTINYDHPSAFDWELLRADLVVPEGANTVAIDLLEDAIAAARDRQLRGVPTTESEPSLLEDDD